MFAAITYAGSGNLSLILFISSTFACLYYPKYASIVPCWAENKQANATNHPDITDKLGTPYMENNKQEETQMSGQPVGVHTDAFPWEPKHLVTDGGHGRREGRHKASTNGTTSELLVNSVKAENQKRELEFLASMVRAFVETWHDYFIFV